MNKSYADSRAAYAARRWLHPTKLPRNFALRAAFAVSLPLLAITACSAAETHSRATAANSTTYTCTDGRTVKADYPDTDTAVITLDGQTYRLHTAVSADGARYVGDHWQWWTKGMRQGQLAPLKPGETIASDSGVACTAP